MAYTQEEYIGSIGATGTSAANETALESDLILLLGTRLSDFTTSSKSQFQHPEVKFIHVNVNAMDASKLSALPLKGDARAVLKRSEERRVGQGGTTGGQAGQGTQGRVEIRDAARKS